jgi:NTE family protein
MENAGRAAVHRGLVIGAGAALGGAWALAALAEVEGLRRVGDDVVVGTSSGSVLAALTGCGVTPRAMARRLFGGSAEIDVADAVDPSDASDAPDALIRALVGIPCPIPVPGNLLLAARTLGQPSRPTEMTAAAALAPRGRGSLAPVADLIEEFNGAQAWPVRPQIWIVAMDYDSGQRVVFGRPGAPEASLPQAVMASCSAPISFPPTSIAERRYIDGGAVSATNADVLVREHLDEVTVLGPAPRSPAAPWQSLHRGPPRTEGCRAGHRAPTRAAIPVRRGNRRS